MHSVLLARWVYTVRMQSAHRAHMLNNPTNARRVAIARGTNGPRMKHACSAHAARAQRTTSERQRSDDCAYKKRRLVLLAVISK